MARKSLHWLSVTFMIALLVAAVAAPGVQAQPPIEVNGLFYGDNDFTSGRYLVYGYSPPEPSDPDDPAYTGRTRATLYYDDDSDTTGWLYFAVVVDRSVNDNVFAIEANDGSADRQYLDSAGWGQQGHSFKDLYNSDNMHFQLVCDWNEDTSTWNHTYNWYHGYLYDADEDGLPRQQTGGEADFLSGPGDPSGGSGMAEPGETVSIPAELYTATSLQWNMNNSSWDVTLGESRTTQDDYKSAATDGATDNDVTDEDGYPALGDQPSDAITYDNTHQWEWPLVYEFAFPYAENCGDGDWAVAIMSAHNSPPKDYINVPLAVTLKWFKAEAGTRSIVLKWETTSESDNLGFNVWRAEALDGEPVQINEELIPSKVTQAGEGAVYKYTDMGVQKKSTYFYWLQDVELDGTTGWSDAAEVSTSAGAKEVPPPKDVPPPRRGLSET